MASRMSINGVPIAKAAGRKQARHTKKRLRELREHDPKQQVAAQQAAARKSAKRSEREARIAGAL